jgi:hypothetical protein
VFLFSLPFRASKGTDSRGGSLTADWERFFEWKRIESEDEVKLAGKILKPAVGPPYRWRDWAAKTDGITGDELLAFINNEEATLPNGKRGLGLSGRTRTRQWGRVYIIDNCGSANVLTPRHSSTI